MLQTQYKIVHVCTGTYMHTVCAMGVVRDLVLCIAEQAYLEIKG